MRERSAERTVASSAPPLRSRLANHTVAGISFGVLYGFAAAALASTRAVARGGEWATRAASMSPTAHTLALLGGAFVGVFGGKRMRFSGGGALSAIVLGATAARLWPLKTCAPVL